jgi:primary-amine oxidase
MKTRYGIVFLIPLLFIVVFLTRCTGKKVQAEAMGSTAVPLPHPFDPLGESEIRTVKQVLLAEKKIDTTYRFFVINLKEPAKADMLNYKPGDAFQRQAFAVLYDWASNKTFEAVIDLAAKKVKSFEYMAGVTAGGMAGDTLVDKLLKSDPAWMAGLKKRNIHPDSIKTSYVFAGEMGMAPADHREMICTPQYINKKYHELLIDGLVAYVDLSTKKVLKVLDDGGKGYYKPEDIGYFDPAVDTVVAPATKPLQISQPEGTSFTIEGYEIKSKSWTFRVGIDNREGLVIRDAKFNDHGTLRPVLYRASVAEMYVPYGSTDMTHAAWNYYDVGAYRMGQGDPKVMNGLKAGADVPMNSKFLSTFFHTERGEPMKLDSVIAVYEEYGGPITRHGRFSHEARNLVVKYFTRVWNYDYGLKWIFHEDGTIDLKAELTGIVGIKGVNRTTDLPGGPDETFNGNYYGTLVAPHVEAVNHQHFFSFRLDLDVDGTDNLVEEMNTVAVPPSKTNPYGNAFAKQMSLIRNEGEGQRNLNPSSNRHWMIADSRTVNALGQMKSYVIMPGSNAMPYAGTGSGPRKMADFLERQVWVTAYKENETHPAGEYPNSRAIKDGITQWTSDKEELVGKDVVLWYNLGITHIVRPEEWPIMNTHTLGFTLAPFGFFESNPIIGSKSSTAKTSVVQGIKVPPDVSLCVPLPGEKTQPVVVKR